MAFPSSSSFFSFPAFALLVLLLCTSFGRSRSGTSGESSFEAYWSAELPRTTMPEGLKDLASPLSASAAADYLTLMMSKSGGASSWTTQQAPDGFCKDAKLKCSLQQVKAGGAPPASNSQPRVCVDPFFYEYGVIPCDRAADLNMEEAMFFTPQQLLKAEVKLPNTSYELGGLRFLPSAIADELELALQQGKYAGMEAFFGGLEAEEVGSAGQMCSFKSTHESAACHLSGESMVRFVKESLRTEEVAAYGASGGPGASSLHLTRIATPGTGGSLVACHVTPFPSLLYRCHVAPDARLLSVSFEGKDQSELAVCHLDTSYWVADHPAFHVLDTKPGASAICHWVPAHTIVFL